MCASQKKHRHKTQKIVNDEIIFVPSEVAKPLFTTVNEDFAIRRLVQKELIRTIFKQKGLLIKATLPQINPLMPPNEELRARTSPNREVPHLRILLMRERVLLHRHCVIPVCRSAP